MRIDEIDDWQPTELSGNIFKKLISAIKKKAKKSKGTYKIVTPTGTATIGPGGLDITKQGTAAATGQTTQPIQSGISSMFQNPIMLLIPAALILSK
jgi:hypothetical protein